MELLFWHRRRRRRHHHHHISRCQWSELTGEHQRQRVDEDKPDVDDPVAH